MGLGKTVMSIAIILSDLENLVRRRKEVECREAE
jgi:SNF2 family DNA or RNA helicase